MHEILFNYLILVTIKLVIQCLVSYGCILMVCDGDINILQYL